MNNAAEIRQAIIDAMRDLVPDEAEDTITDSTDPIRGLGLDSEDGLDFACVISERLGFEIPANVNPFVDDDNHRARTIGEIVILIGELAQNEIGRAHV